MDWYTVTKTIKGRPYLYRQRTYRVGDKVRTQSQYIGPAVGERPVQLDVVSADAEQVQSVEIIDNRIEVPPPLPPSLRIHKKVRERTDISERAIIDQEAHTRELMARHGLDVSDSA